MFLDNIIKNKGNTNNYKENDKLTNRNLSQFNL